MQTLFIGATGTNVGKTHTTLLLIEGFAKQGVQVGVFKPIETGAKEEPQDAALLLEACQKVNSKFKALTPKEITAYTLTLPAAPFCADTQRIIQIDKIIEKYHQLSSLCDLLLIEGAGGLMVPIMKDFMMIDLIKQFQAKVLLVTPSRLGCINDTLLSMEALQSRDIPFDWCVNLYQEKEYFDEVSKPFYDEVFPSWWSVQTNLNTFISSYLL
ncbi:MAG: ATP-dependent dethiobiotin synthetase BioD [Campylobacterota bacterium]|nr:ATP-dependent dethiobiotin synthetase BioD [Campylobacterota bacterium]